MKIICVAAETFGVRCVTRIVRMGIPVGGIFTAVEQQYLEKLAPGMHSSHHGLFSPLAAESSIPLYNIENVNDPKTVEIMKDLSPDLIAVFGWSQILKKEVLTIPPRGVIGFHPSLLPARRGGAPLNWAIIDGLTSTGQTLFFYGENVDAGDIIGQEKLTISPDDTCRTLYEKATDSALRLLTECLHRILAGNAPRMTQDLTRASYTKRRRPEDGAINWTLPAAQIYNLVRGVTKPFPGAFTSWIGQKLIIWNAKHGKAGVCQGEPGEVLDISSDQGITVATGDGILRVLEVNFRNEDLPADLFGHIAQVKVGSRLGESNA